VLLEEDEDEPTPLLLELSELLELELLSELLELELLSELELVVLSESELLEVVVLPDELSSDWRAATTATDRPVPPIPMTAVATAAAEARRNHRRRGDLGSCVVSMAVSLV
jgi:hypothetical protein